MSPLRWNRLVVALLPALVSACSHFAKFSAHPLDPGASAARLTERHLTSKTWTLQSLTEDAVTPHPAIAGARAKYETAVAAVRTAGERPNPTIALLPQIVTPFTKWIAGTYDVN